MLNLFLEHRVEINCILFSHLTMCKWRTRRVNCGVYQGPGEVVEGQVAMNVGVEVKGRVGRGSLAVCEELVSNSGWRCSVESIGRKACGGTQVGTGRVLVAHVALAGMLDLFYLRVVTRFSTCITLHCTSLATASTSHWGCCICRYCFSNFSSIDSIKNKAVFPRRFINSEFLKGWNTCWWL